MTSHIIGMASSYPGLTQSDWLWKQTPHHFGRWGKIQLLSQYQQPDYMLLYNFNFCEYFKQPKLSLKQQLKQALTKDKTYKCRRSPEESIRQSLRGVAKDCIFYLMREPPLDEVVKYQKHEYNLAQQYCEHVSGPSDFAPIPNYMPAIWYVDVSFEELNKNPPPTKVSHCSWITSGISRTENHRQRLRFLRDLQESGLKIDFYGRNLPDWVASSGHLSNKWFGMAPYYYNLSIENYADNHLYVSEKLWDALLAWCLPIYYGGPAADKLLPPGSYLRLPSLDEKGIAYIRDVISSPDAWHEAKDAIKEARQVILHKLNLLNWLDEQVSQLEQ